MVFGQYHESRNVTTLIGGRTVCGSSAPHDAAHNALDLQTKKYSESLISLIVLVIALKHAPAQVNGIPRKLPIEDAIEKHAWIPVIIDIDEHGIIAGLNESFPAF